MNREFAREQHMENFINDLIHISVKYGNYDLMKIRDKYISAQPNRRQFERTLKQKKEAYATGLADIPIGTSLNIKGIKKDEIVEIVTSENVHMSIELDLLTKHFTYPDNTRLDKDSSLPERISIISKKGDINYTVIKEY